jgi:hypothetical protein
MELMSPAPLSPRSAPDRPNFPSFDSRHVTYYEDDECSNLSRSQQDLLQQHRKVVEERKREQELQKLEIKRLDAILLMCENYASVNAFSLKRGENAPKAVDVNSNCDVKSVSKVKSISNLDFIRGTDCGVNSDRDNNNVNGDVNDRKDAPTTPRGLNVRSQDNQHHDVMTQETRCHPSHFPDPKVNQDRELPDVTKGTSMKESPSNETPLENVVSNDVADRRKFFNSSCDSLSEDDASDCASLQAESR